LHYEGAGDLGACLEASLRAADLAGRIKAVREEAVHLRRAARLWPTVHRDGSDRVAGEVGLLERVGSANYLVGDAETSFGAWSRALELVDERGDPLAASRILVQWSLTAEATGRRTVEPIAELRRAVELCGSFTDSREYAEALATLSLSQAWSDELEPARRTAEEAVRAAHRSGSCGALSLAYEARGFAYPPNERAERDTAEAMRYALLSDDPVRIAWARVAHRNLLAERGRITEIAEVAVQGLNDALDAGASSVAVALASTATDLLILGRVSDAADMVRTGLSLAAAPTARAMVRLAAAQLAVRQGNLSAADMHLHRAKELIPDLEERPALEAPTILAEYLLARRQPAQALALLSRTMLSQAVDPRIADQMLMWAARAAADLSEDARDRRDPQAENTAHAALDELVKLRSGLTPPPFEATDPGDLVQPAIKALFTAEVARAGPATPTSTLTSALWEDAVRRCAAAEMRWEEAVATWRWAQALLDEGAPRSVVAAPLRSAYQAAAKMGATPLRHQAEALATLAKIPLEEPVTTPHDQPATPLRSLTKREQEVLAHLVAGRTYAEIANALFISEKTVSVHVSNLLRKTGTTSRHEVAALASRLGYPTEAAGPTD
jgi:DNA-binding CsgD family transcriptional regulator